MSEVTNQEQKAYCLDILENGCGELGLTLTEEQKQQFVRYYEMLVELEQGHESERELRSSRKF